MPQNYLQGKNLKSQFPIFSHNSSANSPLVYLDSAATCQKPQVVIDTMQRHLEFDYGSVHRGAYSLSSRSSELYENTRASVAAFIGPSLKPEQIIFTKGTTESLNIVANGFARELLTADARIVLPVAEHHANFVPWQQAALFANCEIAYLPLTGTPGVDIGLDLDKAKKIITPNTKVVTLASVGNVLGQVNPLAPIIALAKQVGAFVVLDCAQSATHFSTDYFAMGVDALAFSGHKIYGPSGIGVLALSPELLEKLPPLLFGGGMISSVTTQESQWATGPAKFEAGTPPITEVAGLDAALQWIQHVGGANIHAHSSHLAQDFAQKLSTLPFIDLLSPRTGGETVVTFRHQAIHAHDLVTILDSHNVCMRAGHHCAWPLIHSLGVDAAVRASFAAYSTTEDVAIAFEAIKNSSL